MTYNWFEWDVLPYHTDHYTQTILITILGPDLQKKIQDKLRKNLG